MQLSDFDFHLPEERIAQTPAVPRDSARLLVYYRASKKLEHHHVHNLPELLPPATLVVANSSGVRRSRLYAKSAQGRPVEVLVLEPLTADTYRCILGGTRGIQANNVFTFYSDSARHISIPLTATVVVPETHPAMTTYQVRFSENGEALRTLFTTYASVPLPPYIDPGASTPAQYQTVYARDEASSAAPTAGLHFTQELLERLGEAGIRWTDVTLHVGLGTFLPLRAPSVEDNTLHAERTFVSPETAAMVTEAKQNKQMVLAVGTTSCRTLEAHWSGDHLQSGEQQTNLFIYPGYRFQVVDALLTNFHLPQSSLLLLVSAFLGQPPDQVSPDEATTLLQKIYRTAIDEHYRFYSFGDAMLVLP